MSNLMKVGLSSMALAGGLLVSAASPIGVVLTVGHEAYWSTLAVSGMLVGCALIFSLAILQKRRRNLRDGLLRGVPIGNTP